MKLSHLIRTFLLLTVLGCASAEAQYLRILRASYGVQGGSIDVTGHLQALVDRGQYSFPVTNRFFGADPAPGRNKGVFVTYVSHGREFSQEATEGSTFTFRHIGGPVPPPYPVASEIRFVSQSPVPLRVYLISPYGRWEFLTTLTPGARYSAPARPGQRYIVTDAYSNGIRREVTAGGGGETVVIR